MRYLDERTLRLEEDPQYAEELPNSTGVSRTRRPVCRPLTMRCSIRVWKNDRCGG